MNNEYYGAPSTPNENFLAHYGVKGMKWGVRKAIASGSTRKLDRQYRKAAKKLAKLEKRAANGKKYAKRAVALGAGAAAAGGLAAAGTSGVANAIGAAGGVGGKALRKGGKGLSALGKGVNALGQATGNMALRRAGLSMVGKGNAMASNASVTNLVNKTAQARRAVGNWGNQTHNLSDNIYRAISNSGKGSIAQRQLGARAAAKANKYGLNNVSNNTLVRVGAAGLGAGLAGAAGYNAYRAATTKRAAKKAAQFRSEMNKAFAGTKYANGGNRQGGRRRRRK